MVCYKASNLGINVIVTEESYTSGTSFIDREIPTKDNYNKSRRVHRGLFVSNKGIKINADVNGAYQISIRACEYCCAGFVCPTGTIYNSNPCAS